MTNLEFSDNNLAIQLSTTTGIETTTILDAFKRNGVSKCLNHPRLYFGKRNAEKITAFKDACAIFSERQAVNDNVELSTSTKVQEYCKSLIGHITDREVFLCISINAQKELIDSKILFEGTIDESAVYVREVMRFLIDSDGHSLIIAHNHPSGSLKASTSDITVTNRIKDSMKSISIQLLDHIICTTKGSISLAEQGMI